MSWNAERRQFELDDCYTLIIRDRDLSEGITHLSVPLRYNDAIHTIALSRTNLGARGAGIIAELIKINPHIEGLHLAENNITANGTARIARAPLSPSTMRSICCCRWPAVACSFFT